MKATTPQDLPGLLLQGLNSGDGDSVVGLYEADGVVAMDPAQVVAGRDQIESMVAEFLEQGPRFTLHDSEVVQAGDVALIRSEWSMSIGGDENQTGRVHPILVARRQPEGHWLIAIDRPLFVG